MLQSSMILIKFFRYFFIIFALFFALYFSISHILALASQNSTISKDAKNEIYLYTGNEGLFSHSEILLSKKLFDKKELDMFGQDMQGVEYLSFSYGDRDFMMHSKGFDDINYTLALKSLFINTPALIKVGFFYDFQRELTTKLNLDNQSLKLLKDSIFSSFNQNSGKFSTFKSTIYNPDFRYYNAKSDYNIFHTCNSWSGEKLRDAKIAVSPWTPLAYQLDLSLKDEKR